MGGRKLNGADVPTPGPWCVRGEADAGAPPELVALGLVPATEDKPGGWPYLIRQHCSSTPGSSGFHIAVGIQRLADAKLIAVAPDLTAVLLRLITAPDLRARDLGPRTHRAIAAAWDLLVKVAPHMEIGP